MATFLSLSLFLSLVYVDARYITDRGTPYLLLWLPTVALSLLVLLASLVGYFVSFAENI